MRYKKRYFLIELNGEFDDSVDKIIFNTVNKIEPFLAIRSNLRVINDGIKKYKNKTYFIIAVNNDFKYRVIFALSLISKFYKANLLTIKNSGNIKKIKSFKF